MLRVSLSFKGVLIAFLALLSFLLGGALGHPYLNLGGYALIGVLVGVGAIGYFDIRGVRIRAVGMRQGAEGSARVWVGLESRREGGPFGLDLDGNTGSAIVVRVPDRVGKAFLVHEPPVAMRVRLRSMPLGLVTLTRRVPVDWLAVNSSETTTEALAARLESLSEPDGRLREHRLGEGMRQIHWPLSARLQRLVVRVRDREPEARPRERLRLPPDPAAAPDWRLGHLRAFTLLATLGAIAFLWQQGALTGVAAALLSPLVIGGGLLSLRRAGPPPRLLLLGLYVGILALMAWFVSDLRANVLTRGPIALTVMGIAALFAWDLRDRPYIRAQLFLVVFATVLLPAFFAPRDGQGSGIAFAFVMLALLLAAWAEGRHAIGAARIRLSELGSLSSTLLPLAFFAAMVLILHPWLPAIPLPALPTFGISPVRTASAEGEPLVPGQQGRLNLDSRWPQGDQPVVEVMSRGDRLRTETFDTYREGSWTTSQPQAVAWAAIEGDGPWVRITLRADDMQVLPLPPGTRALRDALLDPVRRADGSVRLSRPAWIGYTFDAQVGGAEVGRKEAPRPSEIRKDGHPRELGPIARKLAGDAPTPREALEQMADRLRTEWRYDLQAPEAPKGLDPVLHFLQDSRRGYCLHFASSLALLGRELGIPTRVVAGYSGGRQVGEKTIFDARHAHAWVEAYVDERWITLDPTPGGSFRPPLDVENGRLLLGAALLVGMGVFLWRRRREPEALRSYRHALRRLQRLGAPVTEATTPGEALNLARGRFDEDAWQAFRETVERYEAERFGAKPSGR
ncbi:Protein-glutamine gamma-glutamyltransferase [compost metagenome]